MKNKCCLYAIISIRFFSITICNLLIELPSYFSKIHLNIILPSTPGSPKRSLPIRHSHQNPVYASTLPIYATCPVHLIHLDFITRIVLGEEYRLLSSSLCIFLHSPVTSSVLGPNILLNTLFSNTRSLRSTLSGSDQVPHPYKTKGKIIVPYIVIFKFLGSKLEDKILHRMIASIP